MFKELCCAIDKTFERAFVSLTNVIEHDIKSIVHLLYHTIQGIRLHLLHIIEHTSFVGHTLEDSLYILKLDHALRNHIYNLRCGVCLALYLLEVILQFAIHINTSLGELTNLRTSEICRSFHLSVSKDESAHINTKTCRYVRKALCCIVEFIRLDAVCRKLSGIVYQVLNAERRFDSKLYRLIENLIRFLFVLNDRFKRNL